MASGHEVWVYDNLSRGHRECVPEGRLIEGSLLDRSLLVQVMQDKEIEAVMHFAAFALWRNRCSTQLMYYQNNVTAAFELIESHAAAGVWRFVFSSTTATYGEPEKMPNFEGHHRSAINPYGFTQTIVEKALEDYPRHTVLGLPCLR